MKKCDVCEALKTERNVIFESKYWRISLDSGDQYYPGRSFVTAKRHVGDLADLNTDEWVDLQKVITRFEAAVRLGLEAIVFNWSCLTNNAFQMKPYNPHIHWHVRPRYDKEIEILGHKFTDKEFGHHYARSTNLSVDDNVATAIIRKIKASI